MTFHTNTISDLDQQRGHWFEGTGPGTPSHVHNANKHQPDGISWWKRGVGHYDHVEAETEAPWDRGRGNMHSPRSAKFLDLGIFCQSFMIGEEARL